MMSSKTENTSGWYPLLHKVLVLPEETEFEKQAKKSTIVLLDHATSRDEQAQVDGIFIAAGPEAFSDQHNSVLPETGQRVMFAKLAGFFVQGKDGKKYRMISDLDLVAIQGEENE